MHIDGAIAMLLVHDLSQTLANERLVFPPDSSTVEERLGTSEQLGLILVEFRIQHLVIHKLADDLLEIF